MENFNPGTLVGNGVLRAREKKLVGENTNHGQKWLVGNEMRERIVGWQ